MRALIFYRIGNPEVMQKIKKKLHFVIRII